MEEQIGAYIPGAVKVRCVVCGKKYYADKASLQCKPCAERLISEFEELDPELQAERIKEADDYLLPIFKK